MPHSLTCAIGIGKCKVAASKPKIRKSENSTPPEYAAFIYYNFVSSLHHSPEFSLGYFFS